MCLDLGYRNRQSNVSYEKKKDIVTDFGAWREGNSGDCGVIYEFRE